MSVKKYRIQELRQKCDVPITVGGKKIPPLVYAIHYGDIALFKALLLIDANIHQAYEHTTIYDYLITQIKQQPLAYKTFLNALKSDQSRKKWRQRRNNLSKHLIQILSTALIGTAAIANLFFIAQSSIFSQETMDVIHLMLDNIVIISIFGLSFNTYFLYSKIQHNYNNPAKSAIHQQITLAHDIMSFILKACGYGTYLIYKLTPIAGILFVLSFSLKASHQLIKLGQAFFHWNRQRRAYDDPSIMSNPAQAIATIRSYQRTHYKIMSIMTQMLSATAVTATIAAWCFVPLTLLGTIVIATMGTVAFLLPPLISAKAENLFESRASQQIDAYLIQRGEQVFSDDEPAKSFFQSSYHLIAKAVTRNTSTTQPSQTKYLVDDDRDIPASSHTKIAYKRVAFFFQTQPHPPSNDPILPMNPSLRLP